MEQLDGLATTTRFGWPRETHTVVDLVDNEALVVTKCDLLAIVV